jgi:hypothetical protein
MISAKFKVKSEVARNRASRISSICLIASIKLHARIFCRKFFLVTNSIGKKNQWMIKSVTLHLRI